MSLHKIIARLPILLVFLCVVGCAHKPEKPLTPEDVMNQPDARLRSIILTKVEIVNLSLDAALRYLTEQSQLVDPDKKGVTIVYRSFNLNTLPPRVTVRYPQATVMQVLDEVCRQARCNYMIGKDGITVLPESMFRSSGSPAPFFHP